MAEKNIQMQRKKADGTYDLHFPLTKVENVAGAAKNDDLVAHKADYVRQPAYATTTGTATAYTATLDPAPENIEEGFAITIVPHIDCGDSPTLNVNGKGATPLRSNDGEQFAAGDLLAGVPYNFRRVGANFTASSGGGVKINGATKEVVTLNESISKGDLVMIYRGDIDSKLPSPDILPAKNTTAISFSPVSNHLVVGEYATNQPLNMYRYDGTAFTKLANPAVFPTWSTNDISFSSDGTYMAVAHDDSPFVTIYKRAGDIFTKLANPSVLPVNTGLGVAFSPCDTYLAVANQGFGAGTYGASVYKRSGDTFAKLANLPSLPSDVMGSKIAFSPNGALLLISMGSETIVYAHYGDGFAKMPSLPRSISGFSFTPDGKYLAINDNAGVLIYKYDGSKYILLTTLRTGVSVRSAFSLDGRFIIITATTEPFLAMFHRQGDTFIQRDIDLDILQSAAFGYLAISRDETVVAATKSTSPYIQLYGRGEELASKLDIVPALSDASKIGYALEAGVAGAKKKVAVILQ